MGSKGKRQKGSFAHDYDNQVIWNTYVNLTDEELIEIANAGRVELSLEQRLKLKAEIETYASLAEAEKDAPTVGGSGRSNDFFDQHILQLAQIYESANGNVSLGRKNPSRKKPRGSADSLFLTFCLNVNNYLPKRLQKSFNGGPSDGIARAIRRAISRSKPKIKSKEE